MNKKIGDIFSSFKSQKFQKFAAIGLLVFILLAIPLTLFEVQQQQNVQQKAANTGTPRFFPCGGITIKLQDVENPACIGNGTVPGLSSYLASVTLSISDGSGAYHVNWQWNQYFCPNDTTDADHHDPCLTAYPGKPTSQGSGGLTGNGSATTVAKTDVLTTPNGFNACGRYQVDFGFQVYENGTNKLMCSYPSSGLGSLGSNNAFAAWCHSNVTCNATTPTPTIPVTDTPTPPLTDTPTPPLDTPTDTPIPSDTPTPGLTITPTDTPGPSSTPTPTSNPSDTPTPTVPQTTPTTVIAINSPKPTLPPTGPGNTIVSVGLIGAAIVVIGLAFAVFL